jgi:EAL domain-containing protein (putative c-di-GMP-specific phosphodiesterase class I)
MRTALQEGQFRLLFQPQYNKDEKIVGAEALIRWEHPERGLITPDQFIPLAEENKLIIPLGEWVIEQVCMRLREWTKLEYIAVNISPVQLHNEDFVERLRKILLPHEANIRRLMLEMTEGIMIENVEETTKTIRSLQKLGIGISIDDFGRGYSSLVYLKNLPLNQLKIDKGFVSDIEKDPNGKVIVGTIIAMATHLNLDVVAEGVETERQMEFLRDQGCNKYQGYYFSYPLTVKQFTKLHSENFSLHTGLTIQ